ncbi:hypothetical protein SAMN04488034_1106 [Salinimicrobium catena]|uniref:Uncharacterized protein n=1 Tax=Salinimicrobium catena TaxID=390640 RepID=A0A1H5P7I5_9FLAO|nr:hypothetical protein [Salinimicrobium catena]SDL75551.1 hypothetical protein SAMN04488140_11066 [Salinimicrobium catena]SEF09913.1 hypothetical protein SAMN04488034_1106 [Salinimicrobium catena]
MKEKFRTFIIIYAALLSGIILMAVITEAIDFEAIFQLSEEELPWLFLPVAAITLSEFLYRNSMKQMATKTDEDGRIAVYQSASIVRWAILEGTAIVCIVMPSIPDINILITVAFYLLVCPRYWRFQQIVAPM